MKKITLFLMLAFPCGLSVANEGPLCVTKIWGGPDGPGLVNRLSRELGKAYDFGATFEPGPMKSITITIENKASQASLIFAHDINSHYTARTKGFKFAPGCSQTVTFQESIGTIRMYQVKVAGHSDSAAEGSVFKGTSSTHRFDLEKGAVCAEMTHHTVNENEYTLNVVLADCKSEAHEEL